MNREGNQPGRRVEGLLFDLDGTVYQEGQAIPGAAAALEALRRRGVPFRFTTNTTRRPRAAQAEHQNQSRRIGYFEERPQKSDRARK